MQKFRAVDGYPGASKKVAHTDRKSGGKGVCKSVPKGVPISVRKSVPKSGCKCVCISGGKCVGRRV